MHTSSENVPYFIFVVRLRVCTINMQRAKHMLNSPRVLKLVTVRSTWALVIKILPFSFTPLYKKKKEWVLGFRIHISLMYKATVLPVNRGCFIYLTFSKVYTFLRTRKPD